MNKPASSKYVPGLPSDDGIDTQTNAPVDDSIKIYDGVADCTMNDADTLKSVKSRAKDLAIQKVQQKIADYVYGFWKDRYLTLPDDEVLSIANEICTITDVKYNMQDSDGDKMIIRATVLAQIDDNDIMNYVIKCFNERTELKSQVEALRKENEDLRRQIADLKRQRDNSQKNTQQITFPVISNEKIALAKQKADEAMECFRLNRYTAAIMLYDEAIRLNPNFDMAYNNRGLAYKNLRQYDQAIQDFDKALQINPNNASAEYNRGQTKRLQR